MSANHYRIKFKLLGDVDLNVNSLMQKLGAGKPVSKRQEGIGNFDVVNLIEHAVDGKLGIIKILDYDNKPQSSFAYNHKTNSYLLYDYLNAELTGEFYVEDLNVNDVYGIPIGLLQRVMKNCGSETTNPNEAYVALWDHTGNPLSSFYNETDVPKPSKPSTTPKQETKSSPTTKTSPAKTKFLDYSIELPQLVAIYRAIYKACRKRDDVKIESVFQELYIDQLTGLSIHYDDFLEHLQEKKPYVSRLYIKKLRTTMNGFKRYHAGKDQLIPNDVSSLFYRWYR